MPSRNLQNTELWWNLSWISSSLKTLSSRLQGKKSLCRSCASLDLVQIFNFGALELDNDVIRWKFRSSCELCSFIRELSYVPIKSRGLPSFLWDERTYLSLIVIGLGNAYRLSSTNNSGNWTLFGLLAVEAHDIHAPLISHRHIKLVKTTVQQPKTPDSLLYGREIGPQFDFGLAKDWLMRCTSHHGEECRPASLQTYAPEVMRWFTFRVIDVYCRRVVEAPAGCTYIALSYVWGETDQLKLEKSTCARLMADGGLDDAHDDISVTIRDAMIACEKLGTRYLWADALCIIQDDIDDRERQIQRMDLVYRGAVLTIVNGAAQAADQALPGVRPNTRPTFSSATIRGTTVAVGRLQFEQSMRDSPWKSRGWTFQEETLSSRLLIFTKEQIFWECSKSTWWEDTIFETEDDDIVVDLMDLELKEYSQYARYRRPIQNRRHYPVGITPDLTGYGNLVTKYSTRTLRYDSDALRAFTGILRSFGTNLDGYPNTFFCGIPTVAFDRALMWEFRDTDSQERREGFPSWSWAGWKSSISFYRTTLHDLRLRESVARKDIIWRLSGSPTRLPTYSCYGHMTDANMDLKLKWIPSDAETYPPDSNDFDLNAVTRLSLGLSTLRFWTSSATLPLYDDLKALNPERQCPCDGVHRYTMTFRKLDTRHPSYNYCSLPCHSVDPHDPKIECIVVSQEVVQADLTDTFDESDYDSNETDEDQVRTARPTNIIIERRLFTLCIIWVDGIAQRIGKPERGFKEEDWMLLSPTWKFVELG